jgi:Dyp-type peroxidase family
MTAVVTGQGAAALAPVDAANEPILAIDEIQAHVVPGFPHAYQRFIGVRLPGSDAAADAARSMLSMLAPEVTSARAGLAYRSVRRAVRHGLDPVAVPAGTAIAVALSARCLRVLGHPDLAELDQAFDVGMAARRYLRDPPPRGWQVGHPGAEIDILVILADDDEPQLADTERRILEPGHGLTVVHQQTAHRLPGEIEHFGFRDGISQPGLRGRVNPDTPLVARQPMPAMPDGRAYARAGDVLVWPGQFLFGLPRQSATSATAGAAPRPTPDLARNGSLLVYRKLAQDVAAFDTDTARMAAALSASTGQPVSPETVRAWLVGRWPDGTPLVRAEAPGPTTPDPAELNHFGYDNDVPEVPRPEVAVRGAAADPDGRRCPLAAHIRKVNPRDQETDQGGQQATLTTMILRRGIPYGPAYDHDNVDAPDNTAERGLLFLCYQTDLARQFELLVQRWAHPTDRPRQGLTNGTDLIIGRTPAPGGTREAPLPGGTVATTLDYVTPLGGAYLFTPSIPALQELSR